ncbi:MAG TPA: helix-turn-helix domain-containing protein [Pyrinomonadaceae bacterium]|jgi:excisionase family DNA binding protein
MNLIGTKEAAEKLGVSQKRVQALIKSGRLPAEKIGRDLLIKVQDLQKVAERKPGRPPKKKDAKA